MKRLLLAMAAFVALGILAWTTLSDSRVRLVTLAILGMFALKTWVRRHDAGPVEQSPDESADHPS